MKLRNSSSFSFATDAAAQQCADDVVLRVVAMVRHDRVGVHVQLGGGHLPVELAEVEIRIVSAEHRVGPLEELRAVLDGHAEDLADRDQRQHAGHVGHEFAFAARRDPLDRLAHHLAKARCVGIHLRRRERVAHDAPVLDVLGRIHVQDHRAHQRQLVFGHVVEEGALERRGEQRRVLRDPVDVLLQEEAPEALSSAHRRILAYHARLAQLAVELVGHAAAMEIGIAEVGKGTPGHVEHLETNAL
ncbi:MAG: hypothetical protein IPF57_14195 [Gammaproteobacteria bacterium]|nr:hypothetical protein [Gammaproteobacteria bacterium]